jgi:hypothetical protein
MIHANGLTADYGYSPNGGTPRGQCGKIVLTQAVFPDGIVYSEAVSRR